MITATQARAGALALAGTAGGLIATAGALIATAVPRAVAGPPQFLPITAEWCLASAGPCLQLEVPAGDQQYVWGLQQRPPLPPLRGMWFRFSPPSQARFWMHLTPEPLDMLFLRDGRVVAIESALPCMRLPCRSYGPLEPVDGVVELAAGEALRLGLRPGSPATPRLLVGPGRPAAGGPLMAPPVSPAAPARD
jgi:uncharacterized membrane protein (UPF0127 family)